MPTLSEQLVIILSTILFRAFKSPPSLTDVLLLLISPLILR